MNKRTFHYLSKGRAIPSPAGSPLKDKNILIRDGENLSLKKVGIINVQEQIQSHHDGVCLANMIKRFQRGDTSAFEHQAGYYADVSGSPEDMRSYIDANRALMANVADQLRETPPAETPPAETPKESEVSVNG